MNKDVSCALHLHGRNGVKAPNSKERLSAHMLVLLMLTVSYAWRSLVSTNIEGNVEQLELFRLGRWSCYPFPYMYEYGVPSGRTFDTPHAGGCGTYCTL